MTVSFPIQATCHITTKTVSQQVRYFLLNLQECTKHTYIVKQCISLDSLFGNCTCLCVFNHVTDLEVISPECF